MARYYATGKRKTAVAKVWISNGSGKIVVNGMSLDEWLGGHEALKLRVRLPLILTKMEGNIDVVATTLGGGYSAQADALKHGISKALCVMDEGLRAVLKPHGLLTRDARIVERKKYGKHKARRSPQFSKR
ncbi:MAG: 30S ribosomal protein S9 [Epsilonproteobacteria bacterium]|nr:30S ribosomal protein S9 [Campylobacterota bacterium]NPA57225.1 30S ribosomal protein S9 [Campylobacterota bacterium]